MQIFGRRWTGMDTIDGQYQRDYDDVLRMVILNHVVNPIYYGCELCREPFRHWLCDDRQWNKLPLPLRAKVLCPGCYRAARKMIVMGLLSSPG